MEKLNFLSSGDAFYPLILLVVLTLALTVGGLWLIFKFFKKLENRAGSAKENEFFADKNFVDYLNEESSTNITMFEAQEKEKDGKVEIVVSDFSENEILKLAKRYNVGQGEVELLLNLRSRARKENRYDKVLSEIEKGTDIKKVAKKYGVGCGEIQFLLNLKNKGQGSFWQGGKSEIKWR
ncbi:hypothetical protein JGI3_01692 [Candidatus Kryptobacter tengchongensis]|nr:hypothetical protein JGI3_01692 [Candidatus Kryptobacter tengchongensis]